MSLSVAKVNICSFKATQSLADVFIRTQLQRGTFSHDESTARYLVVRIVSLFSIIVYTYELTRAIWTSRNCLELTEITGKISIQNNKFHSKWTRTPLANQYCSVCSSKCYLFLPDIS